MNKMIIWLSWETTAVTMEEQTRLQKLFESAAAVTMEQERIPFPVEISMTVTTAEEVHRINREFRGQDRTTDVLSFPMVEYETEDHVSELEHGEWNPDTGCVVLGDVILNYEQAVSQAAEYGHTTDRELVFLVIHSLLHLLGYDHMEPEEETVMREHQRRILNQLHILR